MFKELDAQRLLALFCGGWLVFNFPLLALLDQDVTWFGVPLFPAAIFLTWLLLIALTAWLMERPGATSLED